MSASLVGSEMCIRDRIPAAKVVQLPSGSGQAAQRRAFFPGERPQHNRSSCLLYTSDAADDM
eukprot:4586721-Alexandrium_andersonii.AAC.1